MAFNPDQYLAEKTGGEKSSATAGGFDPDKYLAEKAAPKEEPGLLSQAGTAVKDYVIDPVVSAIDYPQAPLRQAAMIPSRVAKGDFGSLLEPIKQLGRGPSEAPTSSEVLESYGVPKNRTVGSFMQANPLMGSSYEQSPSPEDPDNVVIHPSQAGGMLADTLVGGEGMGLVGKGAGKVAKVAGSVAETQAFRGAGAMLKDFRTAAARDQVQDIGRFMLDKKMIQAGDTFEDVAEKAGGIQQQAGQKLDSIYKTAIEKIQKLPDDKIRPVHEAGFNPLRDKGEILSIVKEKLGDAEGANSSIGRVRRYIDQVGAKYGDNVLDPKTTNNLKTEIDRVINYSRNPLNPQPGAEKAFSGARDYFSKKVDSQLDAIDTALGDSGSVKGLKEANKEYGMATTVKKIAADKTNRESANRMFGLTDTIAGSAGAGVGAMLGGGPGAMLGTAAGAVANRLGRTYGTGILASGADKASKAADLVSKLGSEEARRVGGLLNTKKGR